MKYVLIILVGLLFSCNNDVKKIEPKQTLEIEENKLEKNKNFEEFVLAVYNYEPSKIDLNKEEFLEKFDVDYMLNNDSIANENKTKIVNIILLKQYLYHLNRSNQGFSLKSMRQGNAKLIIDYFLEKNDIEVSSEFINTGIAYIQLKQDKSKLSPEEAKLIGQINAENTRIEIETKSVIEKN